MAEIKSGVPVKFIGVQFKGKQQVQLAEAIARQAAKNDRPLSAEVRYLLRKGLRRRSC